jgi:hypothetical protein
MRHRDWSAPAEVAVLSLVLGIAALVSYTHLRAVWTYAGSPWPDLGPLLVDGLFASAWLRMRRRRREGVAVGGLAWVALLLALVATLAGNVAAAHISGHTTPLAYVVAAWPAIALCLVWELVTGHGRPATKQSGGLVASPPDASRTTHPRKPSRSAHTAEAEGAPSVDDLDQETARLIREGYGRRKLAAALNLTEWEARDLLERHKNGATA